MFYYSVLSRTDQITLRQSGWVDDLIQKYDDYLYRRMQLKKRGRLVSADSNKSKVYAAEFAFSSQYRQMGGVTKTFSDIEEARKYMNRVIASETWKKLCNVTHIELREKAASNGRGFAGLATYGAITLDKYNGLNVYVLLHEMAHCAGHMHHDMSFRITLVKLVSRFMGADAGTLLKKSFKASGLRMHQKNSVMPPMQWLRSYNKMAAMRKYAGIGG